MAKKIISTEQAVIDQSEILEYWYKRNGNKRYSNKLSGEFRKTIRYIARFNYLGRATDIEDVRVAVCGNYLIFYKLGSDTLEIVPIFDSRRNPDDLKI